MIDHISIGSHDLPRAVDFYTACFAPLGYALVHRDATQAIFGANGKWSFCIYPAAPEALLNGQRTHFAIQAPSAAATAAFHAAALVGGAQGLRAPGPRPDINESYYGAMVTDPDGHAIEVVHWR